jgi:hypothetical protein
MAIEDGRDGSWAAFAAMGNSDQPFAIAISHEPSAMSLS